MPNPEPQRSRNPRSSQPAPVSGAGKRRDAWLLSLDDGLLLELGPLLGDRYRTRPIEGIEALAEAGTSPWLLIFDASLRHDARAIAARIEQQYPMAPIIIVCADGQSSSWASALHRGSVCAILERDALTTRAWQDALQIAEQRLDSAAAAATSTTLASLSSTRNPFPPKRRLMLLLPLLLLAGGLGWYFFGRAGNDHAANAPTSALTAATPGATNNTGKSDAANPAPAANAPPAAPKRSALELLSDARIAFHDEKSLLPRADAPGESALELYAQVLAQDPQNDEARDGMRRLFSVARSRIQTELSAGKLDDASHLLASFKGVGVDASVTSRLESDIAAARPRWLIARRVLPWPRTSSIPPPN